MMRALLCLAAIAAVTLGSASAQEGVVRGRRVALVIGNAGYRGPEPLRNTANDAALMARTLQASGFALVGGGAQVDLDRTAFDGAVQAFGRALAGADVALFYYAGYGTRAGGANALLPVDGRSEPVAAEMVLRLMQRSGARLSILVLDASRPLGSERSGLAGMAAAPGTVIAFAAQPGAVADEGASTVGPFAAALSESMLRLGGGAVQTFERAAARVVRVTGGRQRPWVTASTGGLAFAFNGAPEAKTEPLRADLLRARAAAFVDEYYSTWSSDDGTALRFAGRAYAAQVTFYGQPTDRAAIGVLKQEYVARWPERTFHSRPKALAIECGEGGICNASGVVDWLCGSPARHARAGGAASFALRLDLSGAQATILGETSAGLPR